MENLIATVERVLAQRNTCEIEVPEFNGSPVAHVCGRAKFTACSDCGTMLCEHHCLITDNGAMCNVCQSLQEKI